LKGASAPQNNGQQLEVAEGTSPRGLPCHCTDKAGNIYSDPLHNYRVVLLLLWHRRGAGGNGLGTTIKYLRRTTSAVAGYGLGTTIKYPRRTTSGAAGNGLGTTTKHLGRTTSGAAGNSLGTTIKYLCGAAGIGLGTTTK
jgi:hypothetical protein